MQKTPMGRWDVGLAIEKKKEAVLEQGNTITVDKDAELVLEYKKGNYSDLQITVAPGVRATIIDCIPEELEQSVQLTLEQDAVVHFATIQEGRYKAKKKFVVGKNASLALFELNKGHVASRSDVDLYEHAELISTSMYLGEEADKINFGCSVRHKEQSDSQLFTKGVLRNALSIYDAAIIVEKNAPHSNSHQRADALLLTEKSEAKSSPQLFIENNDITCSHAATTTHTDEELLFYLMSRGLTKNQAEQLMIKAFLWPVLEKLPKSFQEKIASYVEEKITQYTGVSDE